MDAVDGASRGAGRTEAEDAYHQSRQRAGERSNTRSQAGAVINTPVLMITASRVPVVPTAVSAGAAR